jgi:polysaccharide export outer membrane protein
MAHLTVSSQSKLSVDSNALYQQDLTIVTVSNRFTAGSIPSFTALLLMLTLAGCSSLGASGPSTALVKRANGNAYDSGLIKVVELNDQVARRLGSFSKTKLFSEILGDGPATDTLIGNGDIIDIALWEAPPAVLFGVTGVETRLMANASLSQGANLPQQMVGNDGRITVPFIGPITVAGRTTRQVELDIVARLTGKAHDPQAVVRLIENAARNVTVVGDVGSAKRMPLTAKGERLLDALAAAGGAKQPVGKTTIQVSRGKTVVTMPLNAIIRDPSQNVRMQPDDVVTALFQPFSFTALGAVNQNAEIPFEGNGLTLAQALGRMGGLRDERADIRGVFIFRMEEVHALDPAIASGAKMTADGRMPVIYRINLRDPASFFAAQEFAIQDKDVIYVSNAPIADFQKFANMVSSLAFSFVTIGTSVP